MQKGDRVRRISMGACTDKYLAAVGDRTGWMGTVLAVRGTGGDRQADVAWDLAKGKESFETVGLEVIEKM